MRVFVWGFVLAAAALAVFLMVRGVDEGRETQPLVDALERTPDGVPEEPVLKGRPEAALKPASAATPVGGAGSRGLVVVGELRDPEGKPASHAEVEIQLAEAGKAAGVADGAGRFRLTVPVSTPKGYMAAHLRATHSERTSLFHLFGVPQNVFEATEPYDLGTLTLKKALPLSVRVRLPAGALPPATVWVGATGGWGGLRRAFASTETDAEGLVRIGMVPHGPWRVVAAAEGAGRGELFLKLPRPEGPDVEIDLPPERIVTVTVTDRDSGAPIEGARVKLHETVRSPHGNFGGLCFHPRDVPPTNAAGTTTIRGMPPKGWFSVSVEADGYPRTPQRAVRRGVGWARIPDDETDLAVSLVRGRTIRWPILAGEVPVPADGTPVVLRSAPGSGVEEVPESGAIVGGHLEVADCGPQHFAALAELPDGALARLWAKVEETTGPEIRFTMPRKILVTLRYPDGAPVTGFYVKASNQGNNSLAEPTPVDDEGRATIAGLYAHPEHSTLVELRISTDDQPWGGHPLASVDIKSGDREVSGVVPRTREVTIVIRRGGEAGLPEDVPLHSRRMGMVAGLMVGVSPTYATDEDVDRASGVVQFDWQPPPSADKGYLHVALVGYVPYSETFDIAPGEGPLHFEVDLAPAGAIDVHVKRPDDGRTRINLQSWNADSESWTDVHLAQMAMGGYAKPDANGDLRLEPLAAGRYRVIDTTNEAASDPVDVRAGTAAPRVVLDVSKSGWVRGRVEVPAGHDLRSARVLGEGLEAFSSRWRGVGRAAQTSVATANCNEKGEFWLRVPGNRKVTLRAEATGLEPAADGGTLTVKEPQEGVVLRLVEGKVARVRFSEPLRTYRLAGPAPGLAVHLYHGEADGEAVHTLLAALDADGQGISFSGYEPGTWTVWIDTEPFAPVVLKDVELTDGETDLGEVAVRNGSIVVVDVLLPDDQDMPRMYVWATRQGEPTYHRRFDQLQGSSLRVRGLGPGTFKVMVGSHMGGGPGLEETVELDGQNEVRVTLDMRR